MDTYRKLFIPTRPPRVILITGGTSGIGRAAALMFAALGDCVTVTGRRAERLADLHREAEAADLPGAILTVEADVTDPAAMQRAVDRTVSKFERLDVVIANAGVGHRGPLVEARWSDLETVLRTNIDGVIHTVRAAVPALRAAGGGHIVLVSSILGPVPGAYAGAYSASKAATDALARTLRGELKNDRIHVTVLWVGQTHTEFADKRLGQPGRVATRWPTMSPEQVAGGIERALERQPRTMTVRWIDRLFIWAGQRFPALVDRLLARVYD
jgi:short-subunit dehydrogenase